MGDPSKQIVIRGACEHNLQHIDLTIEKNSITLVTGVSGSGKSSLVFDTILAEAQRKFFYTLSHYSRQFLQQGSRPKFVSLEGLSPAVGLAQNETQPSRRASVASFTDLSELFGVLFSRFGEQLCPVHQLPTSPLDLDSMCNKIIEGLHDNVIAICAPLVEAKKGHFRKNLQKIAEKGYLKIYCDGILTPLNPLPELKQEEKHTLKIIVDVVSVKEKNRQRIFRSLKACLQEGKGFVECFAVHANTESFQECLLRMSNLGACPQCHFSWPKLDPRYFSANSLGRCPQCNGLGSELEDEEESLVPKGKTWEFHHVLCDACRGSGIDWQYDAIKISTLSIQDCYQLSLYELHEFVSTVSPHYLKNPAFVRVLEEIKDKLQRYCEIGLAYLNLARRIHSLSGGELQRLKLASMLSDHLRGILYILDEPSQGLHPSELDDLLVHLKKLKQAGNSIIIVDHDEGLIQQADWVIDLGPGGGAAGGQVLAKFRPQNVHEYISLSKTAQFLVQPALQIHKNNDVKSADDLVENNKITVLGASLFHLKISAVDFLQGGLNIVTGVSGAGKSSLVLHTLYPILQARIQGTTLPQQIIDSCIEISGAEPFKVVDLIDRKPLSRTSLSMPATFLDVFTYIRQLFEKLPEAQLMGFKSRDFSLHVQGGRCEACKGRGLLTLSMKFLADAQVPCSACHGQRYGLPILDLKYQNLSLADVLNLSIDEALELFKHHPKIVKGLLPAKELGLGYLSLGQPSNSLSGGEAQRLKLVPYLRKGKHRERLLILDEPTQGLHMADCHKLVRSLKSYTNLGGTVIIVEHNHTIMSAADWIVDLGPGAASAGGKLVFAGPVEQFLACKKSKTAAYFREWSAKNSASSLDVGVEGKPGS